ncbi:MAG: cation:proton antiporter [Candidatus Rokubacteria bacterium]|nr:cation:proton antiporter [Candidatus Rokubacteria bacterium]
MNLLVAISLSIIAAAVFGLVARRLRQPLLLGYVLGGALLGPHVGFGIVSDEASIELISEIGLILLLFIVGMEINVPSILQAGRTIMVSGLLQFPVCAALAWLLFERVTATTGGRFDRVYLAVALGLSSTMIVVKLLFDKFEMRSFAGRVTLGILIFQDLWAIAFLALQPSLHNLQPFPLLRALALGLGLVTAAASLSRFVLPGLFRAIATAPELMLITSMAWCFLVSAAAGWAGLSKEMGALIAGMVIAAFPYGTEVVARLAGVRDFFITLFFVALGLKMPEPSGPLLVLTVVTALFVIASRFLAVFPIFALLRLDTRTAGVVAVNLGQISEFSLVIVSLGVGYGHVSPAVASLVLYTLLLTSVLSTYAILFNHALASWLSRALALTGLPRWLGARSVRAGADESDVGVTMRDVFLLGVSREGLALLEHLERELPAVKRRIVAIDFNPETLERLQADGIEAHYGDISNAETLRHAGIEKAAVVVSSISDWFLKGTDNLRLLRKVRRLVPSAQVVVTADTLAAAERLYAEGADYVLIPPALAAAHLCDLLRDGSPEALAEMRRRQAAELFEPEPAPGPEGGRSARLRGAE